jgi:hypothetical protein
MDAKESRRRNVGTSMTSFARAIIDTKAKPLWNRINGGAPENYSG